MRKALSIMVLLAIAVSAFATTTLAGEDGWTLSREEMLDKDKVIYYLFEYPRKAQYLPEEVVAGLIHHIMYQESTTFGPRLHMLQRVKFNLEMRMLDIQLDRLLHGNTFKPEGYHADKKDHHNNHPDKDGYIVNEVEVTAEGPMGTVVYDDDKAKVMAMHPSIDIEKSPDEQTVVSGKAVGFSITVTNTGDVELHDIKVMDPQAPDCERHIKHLYPGESAHYSCELIIQGDIRNVVTVTGYDPHNGAVVDSDDAVVDAINPSIKVEKTVGQDWIVVGRPAIFTITVTNTGDVPLYKVRVADPKVPDCERMIDHLSVLESVSWDCVMIVGDGDHIVKHKVEHRRMEHVEKGHGPQREHENRDHMERDRHHDRHHEQNVRPYGRNRVVHTETFASLLGCDLHQTLAVLETMDSDLYVGACEMDDEGYWSFAIWKTS